MKAWLEQLLLVCIQLLRGLLQWLRQPGRPWKTWRTERGPTSRSCQVFAQPKPEWVRQEIIHLKALMPNAGCRTIAHLFNRRFAVRRQMTVGKTYVADTIRRQQYAILLARRKLKHATPRPVPRNLIWGMDLMVTADTQGRQHLVLAILDHASRACLRLQRLPDKPALTLLHHLIQAVKQYGRPRVVRTDNEACFTASCFRLGLRVLGVTPQRTDPGCPWQNGRIERFIGTVKRALAGWGMADGAGLEEALRRVRIWYNHERPHDHLQGRTPAEVWAGIDVFAPSLPQTARWA